ncbi:GrpB family protein [Rhodococcus sp. X156]|uniref:GrpB family protein n=1 Tax=Rhodococcus sp. X156 TaxID=2499145 RepID=UPI000FDC6DB6|nr:GrpB family protein [Rhodococcus sp. X156]
MRFHRVAGHLRAALEDVPSAVVEHVGSTSVPGLCAKPIIGVGPGRGGAAAHLAAQRSHWLRA